MLGAILLHFDIMVDPVGTHFGSGQEVAPYFIARAIRLGVGDAELQIQNSTVRLFHEPTVKRWERHPPVHFLGRLPIDRQHDSEFATRHQFQPALAECRVVTTVMPHFVEHCSR